ncbi:glycosyltransferase [Weissella paramesenteroides]|uniref:Glycosyltransferase n=1 Tax=Weissella paramesenteroides TaxID=1249 RepID=A0ABD4XHU8_WEIPA|nr:glycosyltransferase [Weissella paramesenteroides]MDF8368736.1 glycosyltransferase [Weissella paramesenteroides]MDF8370873.1 glycosyltransferase [Weissella paramesenteroides]
MEEFTVLMSLYSKDNAENFLRAVESNFEQTVQPKELVLVIDGPIDEKLENAIFKLYHKYENKIQIVRLKENKGLGNALRTGLQYVHTNLVARADSDDISDSNRFERQLIEFENTQDLLIVGGLIKEFIGNVDNIVAIRKLPNSDAQIRKFSKYRSPFNHPTVMFKKAAVEQAGNYQDFYSFEDYHLWIRMLLLTGKVKNIDDAVVFMRTETGMYNRRGGVKYAIRNWKLRRYCWQLGVLSFSQMLMIDIIVFGFAIIPTFLRAYLYKVFLRKGKK